MARPKIVAAWAGRGEAFRTRIRRHDEHVCGFAAMTSTYKASGLASPAPGTGIPGATGEVVRPQVTASPAPAPAST